MVLSERSQPLLDGVALKQLHMAQLRVGVKHFGWSHDQINI